MSVNVCRSTRFSKIDYGSHNLLGTIQWPVGIGPIYLLVHQTLQKVI